MRERAKLLGLFVRIMGHLFRLNNLDAAMAVLSGLRSAAINRLRHTFDALTKSELKRLESVEEMLDSSKNYARLREHLRSLGSGQPRVPYLGMFMTCVCCMVLVVLFFWGNATHCLLAVTLPSF